MKSFYEKNHYGIYSDEQKKAMALEKAAINGTPEEIAKVCAEVGQPEYSARALGIACRFRGIDHVRAFVEGGASFHVELTSYMVSTHLTFGENTSTLLLGIELAKNIPYFNISEMFTMSMTNEHGENPILPFEKRVEILDYLIENRERVEFDPGELLYYAIMFGDRQMTAELEKRGAVFSDYRKQMLSVKGSNNDLYIWTGLLERLSEEEFKPALSQVVNKLDGAKLHCTNGIYQACKTKLLSAENLEIYFESFDKPTVVKSELMETAVDQERTDCLKFATENGWLKQPKKRDELIEYAQKNGKIESTAFLLDFKNRTADLKAERAKSDKQAQRELNAAPDSATALKPLWGWKKRLPEDGGGLMITNYKGTDTEIKMPGKIGKDTVTALGMAFSPAARAVTKEISDFRQTITAVTLPETITEISDDAFRVCVALECVNIPKAVRKIGEAAFSCCRKLTEIEIPDGVSEIAERTFQYCDHLKTVILPQSLKRIGLNAFLDCFSLENITLPSGLEEIGTSVFARCSKLKAIEIPPTLKEISQHAFSDCRSLETVVIQGGVEKISGYAFRSCRKLSKIKIPDTVQKIGEYAFSLCDALETINIPEGVTEIDRMAFSECPNLRLIKLPRSLSKAVNLTPKDKPPITLFNNSPNVTALVYPKSYAERYCKRNNIKFKLVDET